MELLLLLLLLMVATPHAANYSLLFVQGLA
jgi:hypothetical protein